jgi:suppressor of ftsI
MNRRRFVLTSMAAAATGTAIASDGCATTPNAGMPARLVGVGAPPYELIVRYATTEFGPYRLRTRTYNGRTLGPTLRVTPGTTLRVDVVNDLPANPPAHVPVGRVRVARPNMNRMFARPVRFGWSNSTIDPMNNPHAFNTTNLHVHGIQTTPHLFHPIGTSNPAAEMISIEPGQRFSYELPVPADHPAGLHWYHPHHHGATDVQISGGMAGPIVVSGPIDEVPEIAAARDVTVVVQTLNVNPTPGRPDHFELEYIAYEPPPKGYWLGTDYTMLTVNGQGVCWIDNTKQSYAKLSLPQLDVAPGEVVRLRVLNGTNYVILPLVLEGVDVFQIGFDGVNFLEPVRLEQKGTVLVTPSNLNDGSTIVAAPANRTEFLLRAPNQPGRYTLTAAATSGISFQPFPAFELMHVVVAGEKVEMGIPSTLPPPTREYPAIPPGDVRQYRTFALSEFLDPRILTGVGFYINDGLYDMTQCSDRPQLGTAEEWTITNSALEAHPFHVHVNSFQVFEIGGKPVDPLLVCDTILVPPAKFFGAHGSVKFRIRFREFIGKSVFHCHITAHEDTGMMKNMLIEG